MEKPRKPEIIRDTSFFIGADTLATIFSLIATLILTRVFVEHDYGIWAFILALYQTWFVLIDLGLPVILSKDIPRGRTQANSLVKQVFKMQLIVACIVFPIGTFGILALWGGEEGWGLAFLLLSLAGAFPALSEAHRVTLRALGEARQEAFSRMLDRLIVAIGMGGAMYFGATEVFPYAFSAAFGPFVALLYSILVGNRISKRAMKEDKEGEDVLLHSNKELLVTAFPYLVTLTFIPLISHLDKLLLKILIDFESVAIFDVAWKVYAAGLTAATALRKSLVPVFGELATKPQDLGSALKHTFAWVRWVIPPAIIFGAFVGMFAIPVLFTDRYIESVSPFLILLVAWMLWVLGVPFQISVLSRSTGWTYAFMMSTAVIVDLCCALILIPRFGYIGAAWSTTLAQVGILTVSIAFSRKVPDVKMLYIPMLILGIGATQFIWVLSDGWRDLGDYTIWLSFSIFMFAAILSGWRIKPPNRTALTPITEEE